MPAPRKPAKTTPAKKPAKRIGQTLNVNAPGKTYPRDADQCEAARKVFLRVLPKSGPGLTQSEVMARMKQALPASAWGAKQGPGLIHN